MKNILLVDDEPMFFDFFIENSNPSYRFFYIQNPIDLLSAIDDNSIDLVLMDWNLKGESGLDYVKLLRSHPRYSNLPIIMLTSKSEKENVIGGLSGGANDYVTKPFDIDILMARIHSQFSKDHGSVPIKLFQETFEIEIDGKRIKLRRKEFLILKTLLESPDKTFSRLTLNELTSGKDTFVSARSIDTFVRYLRQKLPAPKLIKTIRGKGYQINLDYA